MRVNARINPIRMVLGQKTPVVLDVIIQNSENESKLASVSVKTPDLLGFDNVALIKEQRKRIGFVKAKAEKTVPFTIYGSPLIKEGSYPIQIKLRVHPIDRYDKTDEEQNATVNLRVIR